LFSCYCSLSRASANRAMACRFSLSTSNSACSSSWRNTTTASHQVSGQKMQARATLISICGYLCHSPWQSETVMSILWIRWTKVSHYRFAAEGVFLYFVSCGLSFILWNYLVLALNRSLFIGLLYRGACIEMEGGARSYANFAVVGCVFRLSFNSKYHSFIPVA
jgi:hypothetical protein